MKIWGFIKAIVYLLIQWTWGFLQSLLGLFLLISYRHCKRVRYHGSICVFHDGKFGGISLGMFIFVNANRPQEWVQGAIVHEYGHTIQSLLFGPFYLLIVGIPSGVWCNSKKYIKMRENDGVSYYKFYPEKYANYFGAKITRCAPPTIESGIPAVYFGKNI